jgi:4-amino-4-deoxy-L-arabinose transferase-like glycosyltransferase
MYFQDQADDLSAAREIVQAAATGQWSSLPLQGEPGPEWAVRHGVLFLYLLAPMAAIANFDPYKTTLWFIGLSIFSIWLVYEVGRLMWDKPTGLIAALLWAVSYESGIFARAIWTPSPVPVFVLLSFIGVVQVYRGKVGYWPLAAVAAVAASQLYIPGYAYVVFFLLLVLFGHMPRPKRTATWVLTTIPSALLVLPSLLSEYTLRFRSFTHLAHMVRSASTSQVGGSLLGPISSFVRFFLSLLLPTETASYKGNIDDMFFLVVLGACVGGFFLGSIGAIRRTYHHLLHVRLPSPGPKYRARLLIYWVVVAAFTVFIAEQTYPGYEIDRYVFWMMPFVALALGRALWALIASASWRVLGIFILLVIAGSNLSATRNLIWENKNARFNYGDTMVLLRTLQADVGDRPYDLVVRISSEEYSHAGSLYLITYHGWELPQRFNGLTEYSSWATEYRLGGETTVAQYTLTNMEDAIDFPLGDTIAGSGDLTLYKLKY